MNHSDRDRIVTARTLMWNDASGDTQARWLRRADELLTELAAAAETATWQWPGGDESRP